MSAARARRLIVLLCALCALILAGCASAGTTLALHDNADRLSERQDALGNQWFYTYDGDGNLYTAQDPNGHTVTYTYDPLDRVQFAGYSQPHSTNYESTIGYTYTVSGENRQIQANDSTGGTFTDTINPFDELTSEAGPDGTISYTYNPDGSRATATVAGQPQVSYGYNGDGLLSSVASGSQAVGLGYDNDSRAVKLTLPDGISQNYTYDPASRLTDILYDNSSGSQIGDLHYQLDPAGNRTAEWGSYARLTIPQATQTALYNADNQLSTIGSASYTYDPNGNLTGDGRNTYTWNARNQLTAIAGASTASFTYDPFGRRESATIGGATTGYLYDGNNVVQTLSGSTPTVNYLLGPGLDERYARTDSNGTQSYLTDGLGSTLALANSDQSTPTTYTYDPFGGATTAGTASSNPYQFAGQQNDGTGLNYDNARYYSPGMGSFISPDPAGNTASGADLYQYANQNPTNTTDPTGLDSGAGGPVLCLAQVLSGNKDFLGSLGCGLSSAAAIFAPEAALGEESALGAADAGASESGMLDRLLSDAGSACDVNSFTSGTPVLMADGKETPISKLKVGDKVMSTDPSTGQQGAHKVIGLINDSGLKQMVNVTLSDGETLRATAHHPFWDATTGQFEYATGLRTGDQLQEDNGTTVSVTALRRYTATEHVYNLTIQGIHTYYVGTHPVLVHNSCATEDGLTWAEQSGILRDAAAGKGNYGLGSATASEANGLGRDWVGEGYTVASDGKTLVSADGLRQFRPPSFKPNLGIQQANFERRFSGQLSQGWQGNGHLNITGP